MQRRPAMKNFIFATSVALVSALKNTGAPVKDKFPWYHSTDEIHEQLTELVSKCKGADAQMYQEPTAGLDVLHFKAKESSAKPRVKAFLVFGEHARELISPETALGMAKTLCGQGSEEGTVLSNNALQKVEFVLVPNASPTARRQVEAGSYCKRTNEHGVDLNRNWGDEHISERPSPGDEEYPGASGFSEPETQALQQLLSKERPELFLSVHSGAYLLGAPFGYKEGEENDEADMKSLLEPISNKYCNGECPYGGLADMIGYKSKGCDIDWVSEHLGTPYAFTWEIYTSPDDRAEYAEKARAQRAGGNRNASSDSPLLVQTGQHGRARWARARGGLRGRLESGEEPESEEDADGCISQFLPQTKQETDDTVENWSQAFLDLAATVAERHQSEAFLNLDISAAVAAPKDDPLSKMLGTAPEAAADATSAGADMLHSSAFLGPSN